jgi:hypothetical protein
MLYKPSNQTLELMFLGTAAVGVTYALGGPEMLLAAGANLALKMLMRFVTNRYGWNKYEDIFVRPCDAFVNVASTSFLSSGLESYLLAHAQGFDITTTAISVLSKSLAYGAVGQIFKDSANAVVDALQPPSVIAAPAKKDSFCALKYTERCLRNFTVQHAKFSLTPSVVNSLPTFLQHLATGMGRHLVNHFVNKDYQTWIDAVVMGGLNFGAYLLPKALIPATHASTYAVKCATVAVIESAERCIAHYYSKAPISQRFTQPLVDTDKKQR